MFTLIELTLEPSNNKPLPIANGHFIHGLLFKRLSEVDPKYIDKLHDSHEAKPFALVPATAKGKSPEMGDIDNIAMDSTEAAIFRIGVWDNILDQMIYQAFRPGDVLYIGAAAFVMKEVACIDRLEETSVAAAHAAGAHSGTLEHPYRQHLNVVPLTLERCAAINPLYPRNQCCASSKCAEGAA